MERKRKNSVAEAQTAYQGVERRHSAQRRNNLDSHEANWRVVNLALNANEQRAQRGRRCSD